ncbi:arginine deiminase-related protein [Mucilaginibacter sp. RS28]|uniref:Arginine deiminase-related protein n=1 Tax=Mucilaginibacter straminoryzae TaxID=2932774 RepID=A0A9X1X529_9SPHI|nr:arginine deiminase-related protein [Mucilaginibacter straminoryzae]MCJ8211194.1 arginine deiminase-related protein [Mucilaginibacter straminoryzae]
MTILMIRPANFGYNEQTAESNAFQQQSHATTSDVQANALKEFDNYATVLRNNNVDVVVIDDTAEPRKPDAIFPNNWVSFHESGNVYLYPMQAENRRLERREDVIRKLEDQFRVKHMIDLSRFELQQKFLEGTGSMVLDRVNKIAYACISPRTDAEVLYTFAESEGYRIITFKAIDQNATPIYHTNVLMCMGSQFVVICLDAIADETEKQELLNSFAITGKEVVAITFEQMNRFAGNMLEVENKQGEKLLVMSKQAYESLHQEQIEKLSKYARLIYSDLTTIETIGGGSARCMLAEVALPLVD